jgi:hypothetical protein
MTKGTSANHKRDVGQPLQHEQKQVIVGLDPTIFLIAKNAIFLARWRFADQVGQSQKEGVGE